MTSQLATWIVQAAESAWVYRNCVFTVDAQGFLRLEHVDEDGYLIVAVYAPGQWSNVREKARPNG